MNVKPVSIAVRGCTVLLLLLLFGGLALAQGDQLARTPPMGWNSWNHFACKVTEADVRSAADAIASNGMKDARLRLRQY